MTNLAEVLAIRHGVTALIGGGGKTTLMYRLAAELGERARVICCTTTKIWPPGHLQVLTGASEAEVRAALKENRVICLGSRHETGKLTAPALPIGALAEAADYVLVEADGAAGRPAKAHAPHEPVLPSEREQTILVMGASAFGQPIETAAHRPERYAALCGALVTDAVTPERAAQVMTAEGLHDRFFINQAELAVEEALALAKLFSCPVAVGSLHRGWWREVQRP